MSLFKIFSAAVATVCLFTSSVVFAGDEDVVLDEGFSDSESMGLSDESYESTFVDALSTVAQTSVAFMYTMYDPSSNEFYQVCYDENWSHVECP